MFIWLTFEDWPTFTVHVKEQVSPAWLFYWRMMLNLSLSYLFWVFVVILNFLNIPAIHCISDEQLGSLWWPCAPAGRELLQSLLAEAPECCTLKHSTEPGSGGQLRVTGRDFPLRQCQLPASWKQVSDRSCNAFSRSLDLGWSKEWGFFWEIECLDNLIIILIN